MKKIRVCVWILCICCRWASPGREQYLSMSITVSCLTGDCQSPPGVFSPTFPSLRMCSWSCWLPLLRSLLSSSANSRHVWTRHTTALRGGAPHSHSVFAPLPAVPDGCRTVRLDTHDSMLVRAPPPHTHIQFFGSDYQLYEWVKAIMWGSK